MVQKYVKRHYLLLYSHIFKKIIWVAGDLCRRFQTDRENGLTVQQAAAVLEKTGPNTLTPSHKVPEYIKFFKTLTSGK